MTTRERRIEALRNAYDKWWGSDDVFGLMLDSLDRLAAADGVSPPQDSFAKVLDRYDAFDVLEPYQQKRLLDELTAASGPLPPPPRDASALSECIETLTKLEQWDVLTLKEDGHGMFNDDAPWARTLIKSALDAALDALREIDNRPAAGPLPERGPRDEGWAEARRLSNEVIPKLAQQGMNAVAEALSERDRLGDAAEQLAAAAQRFLDSTKYLFWAHDDSRNALEAALAAFSAPRTPPEHSYACSYNAAALGRETPCICGASRTPTGDDE